MGQPWDTRDISPLVSVPRFCFVLRMSCLCPMVFWETWDTINLLIQHFLSASW